MQRRPSTSRSIAPQDSSSPASQCAVDSGMSARRASAVGVSTGCSGVKVPQHLQRPRDDARGRRRSAAAAGGVAAATPAPHRQQTDGHHHWRRPCPLPCGSLRLLFRVPSAHSRDDSDLELTRGESRSALRGSSVASACRDDDRRYGRRPAEVAELIPRSGKDFAEPFSPPAPLAADRPLIGRSGAGAGARPVAAPHLIGAGASQPALCPRPHPAPSDAPC